MKHLKIALLFALAFVGGIDFTYAQEVSTQGKEFWVSYMGNGFKTNSTPAYVNTQLMISGKRQCTGTVTNPYTGWSQDFSVIPNRITQIDIPNAQGYNETSEYEIVTRKGLQIKTSDTVSVYCTNIASNSFDASYVLPVQALGDDYIIQSYDQCPRQFNNNVDPYLSSAFLIVAVEDNTIIDITPTVETLGGHNAGLAFSITLQAGECYQVRSNLGNDSRDLTGSRVTAHNCKPIAVFNGNTLTTVPNLSNGFDHIFEQAMPVRAWGKKFVVTQSSSRRRDYVKIVSASNNNMIKQNGTVIATLQSCESLGFYLNATEKSCYIESTYPCAVYLYNTTSSDDNDSEEMGDPSMLWIAPVEQRLNEITFTTFSGNASQNASIDDHYVNIIVASDDIDKVYFDDELIPPSAFEPVNGNANYSFTRKNIQHTAHNIKCSNGFNAHVYGFGHARGYAYLVGSNATDLSSAVMIDDALVQSYDTIVNCGQAPITFQAIVNFQEYMLMWNFGDGTTSTDNPAVHTYTDNNIYEVTLEVSTAQQSPCTSSQSNISVFYINTHYQEVENTFIEGECDSIIWHGRSYTQSGRYSDTIINEDGCADISYLNLNLEYTPDPTPIFPADTTNTAPHWVVTPTEFQINSYDFCFWDNNLNCHWDSVSWAFDNPNLGWVLDPDTTTHPIGKTCTIYVIERTNDTVWLSAKAYNGCAPQGIERRYWFVCSFYDVDEHQTHADFSVVPNPNNGEMTLFFEHLTGTIDLKVYDMRGSLVDHFVTGNSQESSCWAYSLKGHAEGLYFFVATCKEVTLTKKVIITNAP